MNSLNSSMFLQRATRWRTCFRRKVYEQVFEFLQLDIICDPGKYSVRHPHSCAVVVVGAVTHPPTPRCTCAPEMRTISDFVAV